MKFKNLIVIVVVFIVIAFFMMYAFVQKAEAEKQTEMAVRLSEQLREKAHEMSEMDLRYIEAKKSLEECQGATDKK